MLLQLFIQIQIFTKNNIIKQVSNTKLITILYLIVLP